MFIYFDFTTDGLAIIVNDIEGSGRFIFPKETDFFEKLMDFPKNFYEYEINKLSFSCENKDKDFVLSVEKTGNNIYEVNLSYKYFKFSLFFDKRTVVSLMKNVRNYYHYVLKKQEKLEELKNFLISEANK